MTIKELYEYAKENVIEDKQLAAVYDNGYFFVYDKPVLRIEEEKIQKYYKISNVKWKN